MLTALPNVGATSDVSWTKPAPAQDSIQPSRNQQNLQRKRSRGRLDSSEIEPSENGSVYGASRAHSSAHTDTSSDKENASQRSSTFPLGVHERWKLRRRDTNQKHVVHFVNKPQGTPLFTIVEQKSLATLRSKASSVIFYVRPSRQNEPYKASSDAATEIDSGRGTKAASADDALLFTRSRPSAYDSGTESSTQHGHAEVPVVPHQPPFDPPSRIKTPEGLPRWPGDDMPSSNGSHRQILAKNRARALTLSALNDRARLRSVVSGYFRRRSRMPQRNVVRRWRPPASGHSTVGFSHSSHPFHNIPVPPAPRSGQAIVERSLPRVPRETRAPNNRRLRTRSRSSSSSAGRALGAISGNAIPSNAARVLSASGPRSVPIPEMFVQRGIRSMILPRERNTSRNLDQSYPCDTMRTIDLIERFPRPPTNPPSLAPGTCSTFPQLFAPSPCKVRSVSFLVHDGLTVGPSPAQAAGCVAQTVDVDHDEGDVAPMNDSAIGLAPTDRQHSPIVQSERCRSDVDWDDSPPIRGEASSRYSLAGTPIYRSDAASVVSHDREQLRRVSENGLPSSNYVESAGPEPIITCQVSRPDEAPTSAPLLAHIPLQTASGGTTAAVAPENHCIVPSTVTFVGRLCPHLLVKALAEPQPSMVMDDDLTEAERSTGSQDGSTVRQRWERLIHRKRVPVETMISKGKTQC